MTYKYLNHYVILLLLLVNRVINVNGQPMSGPPGPRIGHVAVLVGKSIYFIGGLNYNNRADVISDFFYYDFGNGIKSARFVNLRNQGIKLPYRIGHTAKVGGINQDSIFIIGGAGRDETNLVYQFNTKTNTLNIPVIQGTTPPRRRDMDSVNYNGKIYMFSGRIVINNNNTFFNNFDILDTVNLVWNVGSIVNAPAPTFYYTATLVNGVIYYIGGIHQNGTGRTYTPMTNIYQYDITKNTWSLKVATVTSIGNIPSGRTGHSAVLIGGKICIYGGRYKNTSMPNQIPAAVQIALLDTTTLTWSIPQLEKTDTPRLTYHTATALDTLMFVAFGNFSDVVPSVANEDYYVFDFGQPIIQWFKLAPNDIGSFPNTPKTPNNTPNIPPAKSTTSSNINTESSNSNLVILGLSIGLAIIVIGTVTAFLLIYRRTKKNHNTAARNGEIGGSGASSIPAYQQFTPITAQNLSQYHYSNSHNSYSPTPQSQRYSPSQEFATLSLSQQANHPSIYSPGRDSLGREYPTPQSQRYSPGQEFATLPSSQQANHPSNYSPGRDSLGRESPTPQSQRYSPGQEFATLPSSQQANHPSNYSPGRE